MKINLKTIKQNAILLSALAIIIFAGAGLFMATRNQINSQKIQIMMLQKTIKKDSAQIDILARDNASKSAQIKALLAMPTPTPVVKYIDNTPSHPNLSSCTLEGNFYFCPSDNCYYNPNGTKTGTCKGPPMEFSF